jgi:hypothetical protein
METGPSRTRVRLPFNLTGISIILVFACLAFILSLIPYGSGAVVTLSVNAQTESLQIQLKHNRSYSMRLPPGKAALVSGKGSACKPSEDGLGLVCDSANNVTLQISGGPILSLETLPNGRFMITLEPTAGELSGGKGMEAKLLNQNGEELASTSELMFFETIENASDTRFPLIIESATIGALLYESTGDMGKYDSTWQPMLEQGGFAVFANMGQDRDRFLLLDGSFDPGDVITMRAKESNKPILGDSGIWGYLPNIFHSETSRSNNSPDEDAAIWGHLSLERPDADNKEAPPRMTVSMNTSFPELDVQRFGAPQGYKISVPPWLVVSELPVWQSFWVIFISLLLIYDAYCAAAERNSGGNK